MRVLSLLLFFVVSSDFAQTIDIYSDENHHNHKVTALPTPASSTEAATKGYVDGLVGSAVSITATAPIVVTPSPITGSGVISVTKGNLTDAGTDGITITSGTSAVLGSGTSIAQHVADATHNGYLSSADWNTFTAGAGGGTVTSITATAPIIVTPSPITTTGTISVTSGNLTDAGTDGITVTGGSSSVLGSGTSLSQHVADTSHNGYLSSTDWNSFNTAAGGGVTSSGNLSPLFTTSITSNTLNFSLSTAAAHNYFGNNTGSTAAPAFHQIDYSELTGTPTIPADTSGAHFVTTQSESSLSAEFSLASISSGILKHTVSSGVSTPATAVAKTDYWDTTDFVGSGATHAHGLVPDPGSTVGFLKFLREDGTWHTPSPLTTKGDIWGFSTLDVAVSVGSNGKILEADSAQTAGVGYSTTNLDAGSHLISNVTDPSSAQDAATKNYVDTHTSGGGTTSRVSGSNFTTTSNTLVDVTGLSYATGTNTKYEVTCVLYINGADSNGMKFSIAHSGSGAGGYWTSISSNFTANVIAPGNSGVAIANTSSDTTAFIKGVVNVGASSGNITVKVLKVTSGTATVYIGSYMSVTTFP